jgi:lactocepin
MQLHAALSTPVVVTEKNTGEAKVALKEVDETISFTLEATNYSDEAVNYDVATNVQTDLSFFGLLGNVALTGTIDKLEAQELVGAKVTVNGGNSEVAVPANGSVTIEVEIDLSEAQVFTPNAGGMTAPEEIFPNGYFVEGFVTLSNESQPELSVPYVGFKGDWNAAPVLDELIYDDHNSFYEEAAMLYAKEDKLFYLGFNPFTEGFEQARIAISPNGDGEQDQIIPMLSFLRNAKEVMYSVLDEDKNHLRTVKSEKNVRKHYYDRGLGANYTVKADFAWDGTVNKKVVADGLYYYEIASTIDYPGKEAQKLHVPVIVDTTAPSVKADVDGKVLTIDAEDTGSGLSYLEIFVNGESKGLVAGDTTEYEFDQALAAGTPVSVIAVDIAGNATEFKVSGVNDSENPIITVTTPATFSIHNTSDVKVAGTVSDSSEIKEFSVNGQATELVWDAEKSVFNFETTVTFEDGANPIEVVAVDGAGNVHSLTNSRTIFVDTTVPEISVDAPTRVSSTTEKVEITALISDNAEELRYLINGSEVFYNEMPGYDMVPFSKEVTTELTLVPGENVFELELVDLAGNTTVEEIVITRGAGDVFRLQGNDRYQTSVAISKEGFETSDVVVLARGDNFADALAGVPLAAKYDAPVLLTPSNKLEQVTKDEIKRLGAKKVYILGGQGAIGKDVETQLKSISGDIEIVRLAGQSRFETAAKIAYEVAPDGSDSVVVVNGMNFPDALSVASYAGANGLPILLAENSDELPWHTGKAIDKLGATESLVIGGKAVVSDEAMKELPNAERIAGSNRFATSVEVAKYFGANTGNGMFVATGTQFADALSGAALAASLDTGILLVGTDLDSSIQNYLANNNVASVGVLGGQSAVSDKVFNKITELLQ